MSNHVAEKALAQFLLRWVLSGLWKASSWASLLWWVRTISIFTRSCCLFVSYLIVVLFWQVLIFSHTSLFLWWELSAIFYFPYLYQLRQELFTITYHAPQKAHHFLLFLCSSLQQCHSSRLFSLFATLACNWKHLKAILAACVTYTIRPNHATDATQQSIQMHVFQLFHVPKRTHISRCHCFSLMLWCDLFTMLNYILTMPQQFLLYYCIVHS